MDMNKSELHELVELVKQTNALELPTNSCLYYSALLYATLVDNTAIKPKFIIGSVKILDQYIFKHDKNTSLSFKENISLQWDGHAWIEIDNLIVDLSLFKTIKNLSPTNIFHEYILNYFHRIPSALIISKQELELSKISYIAQGELSDNDATILINSIDYLE